MIDSSILADARRLLIQDYKFKESGGPWLQNGVCPKCTKKKLFTHAETPWCVRCGRESCHWERTIKELYPDLFESWSNRFKATDKNPHAAADAYLSSGRGFPIDKLKGAYTQEYYVDRDSGESSATVRFPIGPNGWWERVIDRPGRFGDRKARFKPGQSIDGHGWIPPASLIDVNAYDTIWIVEGIFKAIAMCLAGVPACASMSSGFYPSAMLEQLKRPTGKHPKLVWGPDRDKAGREGAKKHVKRARHEGWTCGAALPPASDIKLDWDEMYLRGYFTGDRIEETLREAIYQGELMIARTFVEAGRLMHDHTKRSTFAFEFDYRTYFYEFSAELYQAAHKDADPELSDDERHEWASIAAGKIKEVANCATKPLYFQSNLLTGERWYYMLVRTKMRGGRINEARDVFRSDHIAAAAEFKKRLMSVVQGASFIGSTTELDRYWDNKLINLPKVEAIDFIGYSREHGAYIFNDIAIASGKVIPVNADDFYVVADGMQVKTTSKSVRLKISADPKGYREDWLDMLWQVFRERGLIALVFWFACLFAEQIRDRQESFPFLELVGQPGSGKTTLVKFLWRLMGRASYEGVDPSKSTLAARARNFVQVANLPVVLTEGDRKDDTSKTKKFDFNELKTAYNGGSIRALGVKSAGNETIEPPFRGGIVIEQNDTVDADRAVLERIVHLHFDKSNHRPELKSVAEALSHMPMESVSHFIVKAVKAERQVMDTITTNVPVYEKRLGEKLGDLRLIKNHAQLMACLDALALVVPLTQEQVDAGRKYIAAMGAAREDALAVEHRVVQRFWELYDLINPGHLTPVLNHSIDARYIAVSLSLFEKEAVSQYMKPPTNEELKQFLPTSKSRRFLTVKNVKSAIRRGESVWCYVFERGVEPSTDDDG